jgi:dihydrofolate reductase
MVVPAADRYVGGWWLAGVVAKTQYYTATSIDGFIADAGNSLDWLFQAETSSGKEDRFSAFFADVGAMAMGATTYEWVVAHEHLIEDPGRWRQDYGSVPCWVFTHRQLPVIPGAGVVFARGGELAGQFADAGLPDEILLGMAPVMLGAGANLLPRRLLASNLTLTTVDHDGQFVFLTYHVAQQEIRARGMSGK